jgi:cell division protease FtsH
MSPKHQSTSGNDSKGGSQQGGPRGARGPGGPGRSGGPGGGGAGGSAGTQKVNPGAFMWLAMLMIVLMGLLLIQVMEPGREKLTWAEFRSLYTERNITDIVVHQTAIRAVRTDNEKPRPIEVAIAPQQVELRTAELDKLTGGNYKNQPNPPVWQQILFSPLIFGIAFVLLISFMLSRAMRSAGGAGGMLGNFGKSRHRVLVKEQTNVRFADVAGVDEAKEEVREIVEFLKNPRRFMRLGGRIPRGVLLTGQPGCGKTLLAKAIAGEADVPFFSISGSDFVEMFVGVGASRVRDLFRQAKEQAPCIIFLDEIDAVGRRRGSGHSSGGHDEREQTLNAILVEMDGFESSDQVIVIAATNRPDVLDPALTRPGRFDRQIEVPLPDIKGRLEILKVHMKKVKAGPDIDLEKIARGTPMFSGAELAAIINEAAIAATLHDKDFIEHADLEEARDKVRYGRSRRSRVIEEKERIATAYHEAGHAVLQVLLPDADPLHKVTIIPRGQSLGATFSLPEKDRYGYGARWLQATMRVVCGGRIAEERKTGDVSSGASQDILQLTQLGRAMVLEWGMSERLGFVRYAGVDTRESYLADRDYSEATAQIIDEEIRRFSNAAYEDARRLLNENWDKVVAVAEALLKHESLTREEVDRLMQGQRLTKPTVRELLEAEAARSDAPLPPRPSAPAVEGDNGLAPGAMPTPA